MFERFTDRARRVIVLSQEASRELGHNYIGVEHFLVGLAHEGEGVAAQALKRHDLSYLTLLGMVTAKCPPSDNVPSGHIPFTPRAKKVMEYALREALQLGHNYIGTEHLLLGVIRDADGFPKIVENGCAPFQLRKTVLEIIGEHLEENRAAAAADMPNVKATVDPPAANAFTPLANVWGELLADMPKVKLVPTRKPRVDVGLGPTYNANLQDLVREIDSRAVDTDVLDFERTTSEGPSTPDGVFTETLTIKWRRRTP